MRVIVSRRLKRRANHRQAGFTLTEMIAGLLVASLLVVGLIDITRRYARTTDHVKSAAADMRAAKLIDGLMLDLERADPGSIKVTASDLAASIGGADLAAHIELKPNGAELRWASPGLQRVIAVPKASRFEQLPSGAIALRAPPSAAPLAIVSPRRLLPFDCQFDTVSRECRQ